MSLRYLWLDSHRLLFSVDLSPGQTIATFQRNISQHCWAQHVARVWPPYCDVLRCVATGLVLLAQIWNCSNFSCNIYGCCMISYAFGQVRATMLRQGMRTSSICNTQHVATPRNRVTKRTHVAPNNVVICCVEMLRSFGRGLQTLGQQWCDSLREMLRSFGRGLQLLGQQCCDILRWNVAPVWPGLLRSRINKNCNGV